MKNQEINLIIKSWETQNKLISELFNKHDDNFYLTEVAPGRNRGLYLLGHFIAMNDFLLPMLDLGAKLFPEYEAMFITNPDKSNNDLPSLSTLKKSWDTLNATLSQHFSSMTAESWLQRHTKVSEADFALDTSRNKLNVLIGRVGHMNYHRGQLAFLTPREVKSPL